MVVIVRFRVSADAFDLGEMVPTDGATAVELESLVPSGGRRTPRAIRGLADGVRPTAK